jgi:hypothetical protein
MGIDWAKRAARHMLCGQPRPARKVSRQLRLLAMSPWNSIERFTLSTRNVSPSNLTSSMARTSSNR